MSALRDEQIAAMAKAMQESAVWPVVFKADAARLLAEAAFDAAGTVYVTRDYLGCIYLSRDEAGTADIQKASLASYRCVVLEAAAKAYEAHDTTDRDWVNGSLWDTLNREGTERVRKLVEAGQ